MLLAVRQLIVRESQLCNNFVRNSTRLVQSYHTDEPSAPFLSSAVDQVSQELTNNNTPASSDVEILPPKFLNRNPRNLEYMAIARKRKGWRYQYPTREYYHRLIFESRLRQTLAYVEHSSGKRVVSATTREYAIMRHLHSAVDVAAAENVGRVLAQRCLQCGITCMLLEPLNNSDKSEKFQAFRNAMMSAGIEMTEPKEFEPDYEPGINYGDAEAIEDLERRQFLVRDLGFKNATIKALNEQQRHRHRRRPMRFPEPLVQPIWP